MYRSRLLLTVGRLSVRLSVCLSVWDNRELWPNGWMDRADFWHRPSSPQTPSCIRWGSPSPILGEIRGPKILGSMGRYRKISSYRHQILCGDYRWPKNACQISAQSPPKWGSYGPQNFQFSFALKICIFWNRHFAGIKVSNFHLHWKPARREIDIKH